MKDGRIQQIGEPLEIYDRPRNLFVAGFVGTPPMNLLPRDGREGRRDGRRRVDSRCPCPENLRGFRGAGRGSRGRHRDPAGELPPDVARRAPRERRGCSLVADVVEPLGDEVIVHARLGEFGVVCKLGPAPVPQWASASMHRVDSTGSTSSTRSTEDRIEGAA